MSFPRVPDPMRILYVSQRFAPEMGAPSVRVFQLARHWASTGHDVTVLTAFPNHPTGRLRPGYRSRYWRFQTRERMDGVRVVRTWHILRPNRGKLDRLMAFASFAVSASAASMTMRPFDVVIGTSPQILAPLAAWWRTRLPRRPFVLEIRDLWPESVVATGLGGETSAFVGAMDRLARFLYRRADHVVAVTAGIRDYLIEQRSVPADRIDVVPAAVDAAAFRPMSPPPELREQFGTEGRFVVAYVGTLGAAHGLRLVIDAAAILKDRDPEVCFLMVGEGAERRRFAARVRELALPNIRIVPPQPLGAIPGVLASSDVCLALLRDDPLFRTVVPTKLYEYMAAGRATICTVPGEAGALLETAGAGVTVPPGNPAALVDAVLSLKSDAARRRGMGARGRDYVDQHASWGQRASAYEGILRSVVERSRSRT